MITPTATRPVAIADGSAPMTGEVRPIDVRDKDHSLLRLVSPDDAESIVEMGYGEWIGTGNRRHVRITTDLPLRGAGRLRGDGTRAACADGLGSMRSGQRLGNHLATREHVRK
jgi:hypothetical protein